MRGKTVDILLVEDNPGDVKQFKSLLKGNFDITVAETGAEALDRLFRRGKFKTAPYPDLVVLDLNIPVLNGHEVLSAIRGHSQTFHLPVVVWSASSRTDDIFKAYELGACAYMVKKSDISETESLLASFAQFWLNSIQYPPLPAL